MLRLAFGSLQLLLSLPLSLCDSVYPMIYECVIPWSYLLVCFKYEYIPSEYQVNVFVLKANDQSVQMCRDTLLCLIFVLPLAGL